MNTIKKTRFYLGMSLVARAGYWFCIGLSIICVMLGIFTFCFDRPAYDAFLWIAFVASLVSAFGLRWCANALVKQYGMSS